MWSPVMDLFFSNSQSCRSVDLPPARRRRVPSTIQSASHGVFVMLDHNKRVTHIAQLGEGFDEAVVIALVQTNRGLVEHVEHANQTRTDLGLRGGSLRLTAGERTGGA